MSAKGKHLPPPEEPEEYEYTYSEEEEPPAEKKKKKKKEKPPKVKEGKIRVKDEPQPPRKPSRLSPSRRLQIIADKQKGIDDAEYEATQNPVTKTWRVQKRKTLHSPSAKVEATSTPPEAPDRDILVTWMNMQQSENQGLKAEMRKLGKKYEKLATKYEEKYRSEVPVVRSEDPPPQASPPPQGQPPAQASPPPPSRPGIYTRARRLDVRHF
jgi:hypothetical protein